MSDPVTYSSASTPCSACPWRKSNQGKRHPHGWYSQANLRRLWKGLRSGDAPGMSCHPTDVNNEVPDGHKPVPEGTKMMECAGALLLVQRELRRAQADPKNYDKRAPGLSRHGLLHWIERVLFVPPNGARIAEIMEDPDVFFEPLARRYANDPSNPVGSTSSVGTLPPELASRPPCGDRVEP